MKRVLIGVAVILVALIVLLGAQSITSDNAENAQQQANGLADQVATACARGGKASDDLNKIGACKRASDVKKDPAVSAPQPGPAGSPGLPGERGAKGPIGSPGPTGLPGTDGTAGSEGSNGSSGTNGKNGLPGADGSAGPDGAVGPQGPPGDTGAKGEQGDKGSTGDTGPQGPQGPDGKLPEKFTINHADGSTENCTLTGTSSYTCT